MNIKNKFRKVKILATLGPASDSVTYIKKLYNAGVNIFRLNFSHADHAYHKKLYNNIKKVNALLPVVADLCGPKIRVGKFKNKKVILKTGKVFTILKKKTLGTEESCSINYKKLFEEIQVGETLLLNEGKVKLKVIEKNNQVISTRILQGGEVSDNKGVNLPDTNLSCSALTKKDKEDAIFAAQLGVDFIALSFVRKANDILQLKKFLKSHGFNIPVIAKIEKKEAIKNIDAIIEVADGIMVARGDLGIEVNIQQVPGLQKLIINKTNSRGKPVITATQMLETMISNPYPTRAEVTDIYNAILDGTDVLMLSGETAAGKFPVESVKMMDKIAREAEKDINFETFTEKWVKKGWQGIADAISHGAVVGARDINACAIFATTISGLTAKLVSKYRPRQPIIALTPEKSTAKKLEIFFGVFPYLVNKRYDSIAEIEKMVETAARHSHLYKKGKKYILTGGMPLNRPGNTNFMMIQEFA